MPARARLSARGSSRVAAIGASWSARRDAREGAEVLAGGEAQRSELAHQLARHAAGPLVGAQPRQQPVAGKAARRVLDQALLVGEREGEHAALLVTPRGSGASCGRRRINRWISRARSA